MNHARLLRELISEAQRAPLPPIDWDRVENRLFSAPIPAVPSVRIAQRHPLLSVAAIAAVAAVAAAAALSLSSASPSSSHPNSNSQTILASFVTPNLPTSTLDASELHPGDRLVADSRSLLVRHPGQAAWSLAPGSIATIESLSPAIHIRLELGSLDASVVPNPVHDSFVVIADKTRIGVHGTAFSVSRLDNKLKVRLFHGSLAVGPNSKRGSTLGWIMLGPSELDCSLDGASQAVFAPQITGPLPSVELQLDPPAPPPVPPAASVDPSEPPRPGVQPSGRLLSPRPQASANAFDRLPEQLSQTEASSALSALSSQISACYNRFAPKPASDGLSISVQTTVKITVAPDGQVRFGRFDPPLAPDAQRCASAALSATTFPKANGESQLSLSLRF